MIHNMEYMTALGWTVQIQESRESRVSKLRKFLEYFLPTSNSVLLHSIN
jgi:hypothetical protein